MAGDWIKVEKSTARKPEVLSIAAALGIHLDHAFGLCVRFWAWCDDHMENGNARCVTEVTLDSLFDRSGFSKALIEVGWLQVRNGSLVVPNFDRHLSQTAKQRSLTSQRVAAHKKRKGNADSVSSALPKEEKRRDIHPQESTPSDVGPTAKPEAAPKRFAPPSVGDVAAYCRERGNTVDPQRFVDYYAANGWKVGKNPMKDWKAAIRNWEGNEHGRAGKPGGGSAGGNSTTLLSREQQRESEQLSVITNWAQRKSGQMPADGLRQGDGSPVRDEAYSEPHRLGD